MSKNLTRKGIAFGALVALATSAFAGAPATAAVSDSIVTGLASGTSYNSVVGYDNELKLSTTLAPSNATNEGTLHYRVSNPSGASLEIKVGNTTSTPVLVTAAGDLNTGAIWDVEATPAISAVDADSVQTGLQTALTSFNVIPLGTKDGESDDENFITIGVKDADVNADVTVYAWLDSSASASNVQQDTELYGNTVTLKFYDQANISAVSEIVSPVTGATSVEATFVTTPELNGQQLGADFIDASWTTQGNSNAVLAKNTSGDAATSSPTRGTTTYSGTTKKWTSKIYLKYSKGNDSFSGDDLAVFNVADLSVTATLTRTASTTTLDRLDAVDFTTNSLNSFVINADYQGAAGTDTATRAIVRQPVVVVDENTIQFAQGGAIYEAGAAIVGGFAEFWSVGANSGAVIASGIYSATPYIGTKKLGAASSSTNSAITANDTKASVAVSENVAAGYNADASSADTVEVRTGTTSVAAKATIYYTDADSGVVKVAPAGIPVTGTIYTNGSTGTFQVNAAGAGVTSDVEYTDANGQVTFTVTTTTASSTSNLVTLDITPQSVALANASGAKFSFDWSDAAYVIYDLNDTSLQTAANSQRRIATAGTYTYNFAVLDQWGKAADAAKYRLQVINSGRTVSSNTYTLSNGRVSVGVADGAQGSGSTIQSQINLQKLVSDTWTTQDAESWDGATLGYAVINVADAATESFLAGINGGTTYQTTRDNLTTTWLTENISAVAIEAQDRRVSLTTKPTYATTAVVSGRLINKTTGVAHAGGAVTVSGPSTILFTSGLVEAKGSITVLADAEGDFNVGLVSNTALEDAVITFTSASGATKTVKVNFSPAAATAGKTLTITATDATPGKTLVFTGKLTDKWGNAVDTSNAVARAELKVSYTGPGLLSGALPTETEADGTFTVRVLLGTSDTGSAVVKATYGAANGTIASADTGDNIDIVATATAVIGGAVSASSAAVAGSTGKFYVSVTNAAAKKVVIKVAGKFVKSFTGTAAKKTVVTKSTKGSKKVTVYVGGKLVATKTVTVK